MTTLIGLILLMTGAFLGLAWLVRDSTRPREDDEDRGGF